MTAVLTITVLTVIACQSTQNGIKGIDSVGCPEIRKGDTSPVRDGWCDDHTFRISASAFPPGHEMNSSKRRNASYKSAVTSAGYMITNKFIARRMEGVTSSSNEELLRERDKQFKAFLDDTLDKGRVLRTMWDDEDNCEVVFQINKNNLKKCCNERMPPAK